MSPSSTRLTSLVKVSLQKNRGKTFFLRWRGRKFTRLDMPHADWLDARRDCTINIPAPHRQRSITNSSLFFLHLLLVIMVSMADLPPVYIVGVARTPIGSFMG